MAVGLSAGRQLAVVPELADDGTSTVYRLQVAGGGGGGGGGDASAVNQATQIARETSIRDQIGALSSPAAGSTNKLLTDSLAALIAPTPAGTNKIGGVTEADGDNATLGARADTAATNSTGAWSAIALLKGLYALLAGTLTFRRYQKTITATAAVTLTTSATQLFAADATRSGVRVLNPNAAIVYLLYGTSGTPSSSNYHDLIPAAVSGVPGQWEPPVAPVGGVVAALASGTGNVATTDF